MIRIHPNNLISKAEYDSKFNQESFRSKSSIRNLHIKKSRCNVFIPKNGDICGCGRAKNMHDRIAIDNHYKYSENFSDKWNPKSCTIEDEETDAYGEIRFNNDKNLIAKFIRVGQFTPINKITNLLFSNWKLKKPKLLISVTGGAENFNMKPKLREVFRKGLIKAALSTNAWITSGGSNVGVMKHVGEAIASSSLDPDEKIVVLGISNWSTVTNRHFLIKKELENDNELFDYNTSAPKNSKLKSNPLDPNHSHFILVDNSQLDVYGGEIDFRGELEKEIVKFGSQNLLNETPIVVLVLEGGPNTISTVLSSIKNNSPCVFIEGSGRCADFFAYALAKLKLDSAKSEIMNIDDYLRNEFYDRIKSLWPNKDHKDILNKFEEIITYPHLLTVYRLDSKEQANDIDIAILRSMLKAKQNNLEAQINLALTWNRADIAKSFIFTDEKTWKAGSLNNLMFSAINDNRIDFVEIFLENGCDMNQFLTYRRLLKLYNKIPNTSILYKLLIKMKRSRRYEFDFSNVVFKFKHIGMCIQDLVGKVYPHHFAQKPFALLDTKTTKEILSESIKTPNKKVNNLTDLKEFDIDEICENANHEIFMYCILTGKAEMAKLFWNEASNEIGSALIASKIFKSYNKVLAGDDEQYGELASDFEKLAVDVMQSCYESKPEDAQLVLLRQIPEFANTTSFQIGSDTSDKNFVSSPCYQSLLAKLWYGQIFVDTPWWTIILACFLPILAPFIIDLDHDKYKLNIEAISRNAKRNEKEYLKSLNHESEIDIEMSSINQTESNLDFISSRKPKGLSYFAKIYYFFRSPFVKFFYNQLTFFLFLGLFSYVILCDFYPIKHLNEDGIEIGRNLNWPEVTVMFWVLVYLVDELRQFMRIETNFKILKFLFYFSDFWNLVQVGSISLFIIGVGLRFIPDMKAYLASRIILSLDILLWFFRSLHGYSVIRSLGPKLVMIRRMLNELRIFLLIVIVFIFAYGISTQALMYHNQEPDLELLKNIFFPAYFVIGGEYFEREKLMEVDQCESLNDSELLITDRYTQDDCPEAYGTKVSLGLLVGYLIMLNILLVNLLIAIFSNTYSEVESEADKIWKFQLYGLVYEYFHKPFLATPFTIIYYFYEILRYLFRLIFGLCFNIKPDLDFNFLYVVLPSSELERLRSWESFIAENYLTMIEAKSKESLDYKIQKNINKFESLTNKLEQLEDNREEMNVKINDLEKKLDIILNLLTKKNDQIGQTKPVSVIRSSTNADIEIKSTRVLNKKPHDLDKIIYYPDSNVIKLNVSEEKKLWHVNYYSYSPEEYTSPDVIYSLQTDVELLNKPIELRPQLNFNMFDHEFGIDRRSCLGEYSVENGVPLNPNGRQGLAGRGSLLYWGPNMFYEIIFTRYAKNKQGNFIFDENEKRVIEFLAFENEKNWFFPSIAQEKNTELTELIERKMIVDLFTIERVDERSLSSILKNPIIISKYYKESKFNTDNAWLEFIVVNIHDRGDRLFSKIRLKDNFEDKCCVWKEINDELLKKSRVNDSNILKRLIKLHQF